MLNNKICKKQIEKAKRCDGKSEARPLLRLQIGSPVRATTSLVAATPGGFTTDSPPKHRLSSPRTSKIDIIKLEINLMELKPAQHRTKTCIQIEKWVCELQDTMAGS